MNDTQAYDSNLLSIEWIPVDELFVDHRYQRVIAHDRVKRMADNWDWKGCGVLYVSLRNGPNGSYYSVIDGQQRLAAIRLQDFKKAPCRIYIDLTVEQEAELFEVLNNSVKPSHSDIFRARLTRDEPVAMAINKAVQDLGFHLDLTKKPTRRAIAPNAIYSTYQLDLMHETGGITLVTKVLSTIKAMWPETPGALGAIVLGGVAIFYNRYREIGQEKLLAAVKGLALSVLLADAQHWLGANPERPHSTYNAVAESLLWRYNRGVKSYDRLVSRLE